MPMAMPMAMPIFNDKITFELNITSTNVVLYIRNLNLLVSLILKEDLEKVYQKQGFIII